MSGRYADSPGPLSYAQVAINRPPAQSYTYFVPESLHGHVKVGSLVRVPLRNEQVEGVVLDLTDQPAWHARVKPITGILTPDYAIPHELLDLAHWISDYYFCSVGEALATVSFIGLNDVSAKMQSALALADPDAWHRDSSLLAADGKKITANHRRVIDFLLTEGNRPIPQDALGEAAAVGPGVIATMLKHGWLLRHALTVERDDEYDRFELGRESTPPPTLTSRQAAAFLEMTQAMDSGRYQTFLLHGVTGSGKTELYLRVIEEALREARSAIVLVPEISLTPQVVDAFRRRLGDIVGVYHSKLNVGQKYDLWRRIQTHQARVVIGARSAIFSPLSALGVVIVDEEHEPSYKQGETPRYHARDVAVVRASRAGAICILGSATPSIETLHNAREGKYRRINLPDRIGPHAPPFMTLVDMKRHAGDVGKLKESQHLISPLLREGIAKRLADREQVVLLLNRRGFANHVLCLKCETSIMCPHCDVPMTYHRVGDRLICHWCGERQWLPKFCPSCSSGEIHALGLGTQKIEDVLREMFPEARTLRVDMDSMRKRGAFQSAWKKISEHQVDLILGTQMIAKGLHIEKVTLVGVISADFALFLPDFRSAERTYSLLTQVAGRAGRGERAGEVIVQTYMPHHYAIDLAARRAEDQFYERELHLRRMMNFPPFSRLAALILSGSDEAIVRQQAGALANMLKPLTFRPEYKTVKVLGPTPAPLAKLQDQYRWRLLVRGQHVRSLHDMLREGLGEFHKSHRKNAVQLTVDIDPFDLM